jgi:hypothetical protein
MLVYLLFRRQIYNWLLAHLSWFLKLTLEDFNLFEMLNFFFLERIDQFDIFIESIFYLGFQSYELRYLDACFGEIFIEEFDLLESKFLKNKLKDICKIFDVVYGSDWLCFELLLLTRVFLCPFSYLLKISDLGLNARLYLLSLALSQLEGNGIFGL